MNRIAIICLMCLAAMTAVAGCTDQQGNASKEERFEIDGPGEALIVSDGETGCQYLTIYRSQVSEYAGLTPLLDANARPICGKQ